MCTEMKIGANRMISNFDYDGFYNWCKNKRLRVTDIAKELGYNGSFFPNCKTRNALKVGAYKSLLTIYGLPEGSFLIAPKTDDVKEPEVKIETPTVDLTEITNEIKDLQSSINKLGNIMMQMLEYVDDIRKELK